MKWFSNHKFVKQPYGLADRKRTVQVQPARSDVTLRLQTTEWRYESLSSTSCRMTRLSYSYSYSDPPTPQCRATLHRQSMIVIDYSFYCLTTVSPSKFISCHYSTLAFLFTLSDCLVSDSFSFVYLSSPPLNERPPSPHHNKNSFLRVWPIQFRVLIFSRT